MIGSPEGVVMRSAAPKPPVVVINPAVLGRLGPNAHVRVAS